VGIGDERTGDPRQARDRAEIRVAGAVDHIDGVVRGVGHVENAAPGVDGRVIEPPGRRVRGKVDKADVVQRHSAFLLP
jgi:hypothetical protein